MKLISLHNRYVQTLLPLASNWYSTNKANLLCTWDLLCVKKLTTTTTTGKWDRRWFEQPCTDSTICKKMLPPQKFQLKIEGVLENSAVFFSKSWHYNHFLTWILVKDVGLPVLEAAYYWNHIISTLTEIQEPFTRTFLPPVLQDFSKH